MKIINLVDPDKSQIKYKKIQYPDNQQNIVITNTDFREGVEIKSRMNNFQDLELIIAATQSLKLLGVKEIHLYVPHFLGSRSDRQFEEGSNNYLKHVICPIINLQGYSSVTVLDPHSDTLEACLNGFKKVSNEEVVRAGLETFGITLTSSEREGEYFTDWLKECILVSPDAGASHKIYKLAEQISYKGDIITCSKERDNKGELTKCVVPVTYSYATSIKDYVIVDDIGDRFGTFIKIAQELLMIMKGSFRGKLYLIVTHSIQEEGIKEALKYFEQIYTTNSYKDFKIEGLKQLNVF